MKKYFLFLAVAFTANLCGMDPMDPPAPIIHFIRSKRNRETTPDQSEKLFLAIAQRDLKGVQAIADPLPGTTLEQYRQPTQDAALVFRQNPQTVLHAAALYDAVRILRYFLLDKKIRSSLPDARNSTALHTSARENSLACAESLYKNDKKLSGVKNIFGLTPIQIATFHGSREVFKFLLGKLSEIPRPLFCWAARRIDDIPEPERKLSSVLSSSRLIKYTPELSSDEKNRQARCLSRIVTVFKRKLTNSQKCITCPDMGHKDLMDFLPYCCANFMHQKCKTGLIINAAKNRRTPRCPLCFMFLVEKQNYGRKVDLSDAAFNYVQANLDEIEQISTRDGQLIFVPREEVSESDSDSDDSDGEEEQQP